ncbi:LLM class flavin-dependent oxidoreductase [Frigidibacter sp. MR17.24]|uniref:LLM class flavin-dependent oxidoreductase n=1 Tax=Frigidibacter sp. MR17.24 TaxID=3127345 RepID=UPI003012C90E
MEFGIFNLMSYRNHPAGVPGVIADTREMVRLAEDVGVDVAWFAEHHFTNYSISVSPLMMAAHMAGATSRIRLGTAVIVLPLYQPLRVAQEIALVDQLSGGRLVLGVGTGYQPFEFDRLGVEVGRRNEIFLQHWDLLEAALTTGEIAGDTAARAGLPETPVLLRPVQRPLPPLFVTGGDPRILGRLGPLGATPFITAGWRGTPALVQMAAKARADWTAAGLDGAARLGVQQYVCVTDSPEEALIAADCARFVGRMASGLRATEIARRGPMIDAPPLPDEPPLETFRDNVIIGPADHVIERILDECTRMRPTHYNCFFQFGELPMSIARRSLETFGDRVLPVLRRALADAAVTA